MFSFVQPADTFLSQTSRQPAVSFPERRLIKQTITSDLEPIFIKASQVKKSLYQRVFVNLKHWSNSNDWTGGK